MHRSGLVTTVARRTLAAARALATSSSCPITSDGSSAAGRSVQCRATSATKAPSSGRGLLPRASRWSARQLSVTSTCREADDNKEAPTPPNSSAAGGAAQEGREGAAPADQPHAAPGGQPGVGEGSGRVRAAGASADGEEQGDDGVLTAPPSEDRGQAGSEGGVEALSARADEGGGEGNGDEVGDEEEEEELTEEEQAELAELLGEPTPGHWREASDFERLEDGGMRVCTPLPDPALAEVSAEWMDELLEEPVVMVNEAGEGNAGWDVTLHLPDDEDEGADDDPGQYCWGLDLTGGRTPEIEKNALLSDESKEHMYNLHKTTGWEVPEIAAAFRVRQQRVMAILALREIEEQAREAGEEILEDVREVMEGDLLDDEKDSVWGCNEIRGTGERHVRLLRRYPAYEARPRGTFRRAHARRAPAFSDGEGSAEGEVVEWMDGSTSEEEEEQALTAKEGDNAAEEWAKEGLEEEPEEGLEKEHDKEGNGAEDLEEELEVEPEEEEGGNGLQDGEIGLQEDGENGLQEGEIGLQEEGEQEEEHEEEEGAEEEEVEEPWLESNITEMEDAMAAREDAIMVAEFKQRLDYNLRKIGQDLRRSSRVRAAPKRPKEGWSLVVRPARRTKSRFNTFVAQPGAEKRDLTPSEALYQRRLKPKRRRKYD